MDKFNHRSGEWLERDDAKIYYEIQGSNADPALLLLHGGLGTMEDFNVIIPRLQRRFRLIGVDTRGHGKSTLGSKGLSYQLMQDDALALAQHLRLTRFTLIGFSDGGIVALRMAAERSSRVDKLVAIAATWEPPADEPSRKLLGGITAESWTKKFPQTRELYQRLNPAPDFDALVKAIVPCWLDTSDSGHPKQSVANIAAELLVVRGDEDHLVARKDAFELAERVKKAKLLSVPFAGHEVHKDQTELTMLCVNEFLQER